MATMTLEQFAAAVAAALSDRLVALLLYGSAARGTHVPGRSDVNTLLICDAVDEALFARLEPAVREWGRGGLFGCPTATSATNPRTHPGPWGWRSVLAPGPAVR